MGCCHGNALRGGAISATSQVGELWEARCSQLVPVLSKSKTIKSPSLMVTMSKALLVASIARDCSEAYHSYLRKHFYSHIRTIDSNMATWLLWRVASTLGGCLIMRRPVTAQPVFLVMMHSRDLLHLRVDLQPAGQGQILTIVIRNTHHCEQASRFTISAQQAATQGCTHFSHRR